MHNAITPNTLPHFCSLFFNKATLFLKLDVNSTTNSKRPVSHCNIDYNHTCVNLPQRPASDYF